MAGKPSPELISLPEPSHVAFLPDKIPHVKPRLKVSEGDIVHIGSPLFEDKNNPAVQFLSPAGGMVQHIRFGPRRVVQAIVIQRKVEDEPRLAFSKIPAEQIDGMPREQLVDGILQGGLWWIFRELPFRNIPSPDTEPPLIILNLSAKEPFQPLPRIYLQDRNELIGYGLKVLHKLANGKVMVMTDGDLQNTEGYGQWLTHRVSGNYPSDDPGTLLYHIKSGPAQNRSWFVAGQDLILLAQSLAQGHYPVDRIISVAGTRAESRRHYRTRLGTPLSELLGKDPVHSDTRFLVGGVLRGYTSHRDGFMGHYETALNLIPNGDHAEFLALFKPGHDKHSYSRTFLSALNTGRMVYDCNLHGGERACIACMHCTDVCPVDIMPHMAYKAVLADEVEEFLSHGLLDCVECGLCSYVCPSKIELMQTFIDAKATYRKETISTD